MEQDILAGALRKLPELLASIDRQIGSYTGHISSSKGVTLKHSGVICFCIPILFIS